MSDERYIAVPHSSWLFGPMAHAAYYAAEGQRVETIRWCETHGERAHDQSTIAGALYECYIGESEGEDCDVVSATLILPPKEQP